MDIVLKDSKIVIKSKDFQKATDNAKKLLVSRSDLNAASYKKIEDVLDDFGYYPEFDDAGNIINFAPIDNAVADEQMDLFSVFENYIEDGSYAIFQDDDDFWKVIIEKGKARRIDSEVVYYDKPMNYDRAMCLLNEVVDRVYVSENVSEAIRHLFTLGFTDDELINVFDIASSDVEAVVKKIEEGDR